MRMKAGAATAQTEQKKTGAPVVKNRMSIQHTGARETV